MHPIIIKFGGSSLADPEKIRRAAAILLSGRRRGLRPVAVVSAPADTTDDLLKLASLCAGDDRPPREDDALLAAGEQISAALLAMAIQAQGAAAVSLTGFQAGIRTGRSFSRAEVRRVDTRRLAKELKAGRIPVVAGFQGISPDGDITTLGRGGSDQTAVALARALHASVCEFRTDVKGIYTAHPAIVPEARKIKEISYCEVLALAALGTEVRQLRAVRYAARYAIPLHLRSSFHDEPGTRITAAGGPAGVTCLSIAKTGTAGTIALIGRGLGTAHLEKARAAAKAAGISTGKARKAEYAIIVPVPAAETEELLKTLHRAFITASPRPLTL